MKYRLKHVTEYVALRATAATLNAVPYRCALLGAWLLAALGYVVLRKRVAIAADRVRSVFGDELSGREVSRICWLSWRNTVFNAVEMLRVPRMTPEWIESVGDFDPTLRTMTKHTDSGQGLVIAVPHMGNWDLAGIAAHYRGVPIFNIAARQRNPLVNDYMARLRSAPGIETLERGAASIRRVAKLLKHGRTLAILPDSRMRTPGIRVPMLGGEPNLGRGMAVFARLAGVPIHPCLVTRVGWSRHRIRSFPLVYPDPSLDSEEDVARMTRAVIAIVDAAIRREPGQWFWFNQRWVLDPLEDA